MIVRRLASSSKCLLFAEHTGHCRVSVNLLRRLSSHPCAISKTIIASSIHRCGHHVRDTEKRLFSQAISRHVKSRATMKLDDLPQGTIPLDAVPLEKKSLPPYPTAILQAQSNMRKFENCVLLTRVGGFYELYFEHAEEYGPLLNLKPAEKFTQRAWVPMTGFPYFQLDRFLKILVQDLNKYVAIAEEFESDPDGDRPPGGLQYDRRVTRIITPGTLIDEQFMDPYTNNYILAIHTECLSTLRRRTNVKNYGISVDGTVEAPLIASTPVGLAWLDLSTGHFFTQSATLSSLPSVLSRVSPSEMVLDEGLKSIQDHGLFSVLQEDKHLITYSSIKSVSQVIDWSPMLESEVTLAEAAEFTPEEVAAGSMLLQYVETRLRGSSMKLQAPTRYQTTEIMGIDRNSMRALEIKETMRDASFKGSLLHAVRRTVTKSGARLLNSWLGTPTTSLNIINSRLDLVSRLLADQTLRESVVMKLRRCHDSQRLVQKFSLGRGDPEDLLALATTINATQELVTVLKDSKPYGEKITGSETDCLTRMASRIQLDGPSQLSQRIKDAVDRDGLVLQRRLEDDEAGEMIALAQNIASSEGSGEDMVAVTKSLRRKKAPSLRERYHDNDNAWIMTPYASKILQTLHDELRTLVAHKATLEKSLQIRLGAPALTLRWTPGLKYICHVKGKNPENMDELRSVSASRSTRSFHHVEWTDLGEKTDQVKAKIRAEEQHVFRNLRQQVILNLVKLRRNATVLDELDIACSFALLAEEQRLVRPIMNQSSSHKIVGGRHPTVQGGLLEQGRTFVTNDCFVGDHERIWLITGPNMAGKSTFLRQNALITIMAQVGSYVPAEYAEIGIVDQIFSRVGSADDLYRDQSTFMVEMLETAAILKHATSRSFVIMDEIGRGTTPEDGLAVAFACLSHLHHVNRCRTLFATHFHALADLIQDMKGIGCYCTDVVEDRQGGFRYLHRLRQGVNRESHALKVARLAGLPEAAIEIAQNLIASRRKTYPS